MTLDYERGWKKTFHEGFAPSLTVPQLESLRQALVRDDERLIQGATTTPPPIQQVQNWPVEACCLIGWCGMEAHGGWGTATVGEVEEFFAQQCFECDKRLEDPAACRYLLNWFDETPRAQMRAELLPEVEKAIALKKVTAT